MGGEVRTAPDSANLPGRGDPRAAPSVPAPAPQPPPRSIGTRGPHRRTAPASAPHWTRARRHAHAFSSHSLRPRRARAKCAPVLTPRTRAACTCEGHTGPHTARHRHAACTSNVRTSSHSTRTYRAHVRRAHRSSLSAQVRTVCTCPHAPLTWSVHTPPHTVRTPKALYTEDAVSRSARVLTKCEKSARIPRAHTCSPSTHIFLQWTHVLTQPAYVDRH